MNIVILGEGGVGKSCFLGMVPTHPAHLFPLKSIQINTHQFVNGYHFPSYDPTQEAGYRRQLTTSNNSRYMIEIQDLSSTPMLSPDPTFQRTIFEGILSNADGIIFLYDITDENSYNVLTEHAYELTYLARKEATSTGRNYPTGRQRFGGILVGNKVDLVEGEGSEGKRQVRKEKAKEWASMYAWKHFEVDTFRREAAEEVVEALVESMEKAQRRDREDMERSAKERWRENGRDMWGKKIEPWGEYVGVEEEKKEKKEKKNGLSRSWTRVRDALPRFRSNSRTGSQ